MNDELVHALNQLSAARNEIKNLRQQITSLKHCYKKDVDEIKDSLKNWKCQQCNNKVSTPSTSAVESSDDHGSEVNSPENGPFQTIGYIETGFSLKRGLPRQPGLLSQSQGIIRLINTILTNPNHALEGLDNFSHMWILFHFHANNNTHVRAKVAPPRLNGIRTGVFATRSPHRPCPIGLSLVKIDCIEDNCIFFSGVDMIDGTPVLDIKPYIPQYDMPYPTHYHNFALNETNSTACDPPMMNNRSLNWERLPRDSDGRSEDGDSILQDQSDLEIDFQDRLLIGEASQPTVDQSNESTESSISQTNLSLTRVLDGRDSDEVFLNDSQNINNIGVGENYIDRLPLRSSSQREAPEGSEGSSPPSPTQHSGSIRVADWIINPSVFRLRVQISEECSRIIERISENSETALRLQSSIISVLSEDPRSVYTRSRHPNDNFTCIIEGLLVSCIFDDTSHVCLVTDIEETGVRN